MDWQKDLNVIYDLFEIPMILYQNNEIVQIYGSPVFEPNIAWNTARHVLLVNEKTCYTLSSDLTYTGVVYIDGSKDFLLIGPARAGEMTRVQAYDLLERMQQPKNRTKELIDFFQGRRKLELHQFVALLETVHMLFNKTHTDAVFVEYVDNDTLINIEAPKDDEAALSFVDLFHEMALMEYIQYGDVEAVKAWLLALDHYDNAPVPRITGDTIHSLKIIFIGSVFLASRAVMKNGCDMGTLNDMTSRYLNQSYRLDSEQQFTAVWKRMLLDFARLSEQNLLLRTDSDTVNRISRFVRDNIYKKVTAHILAVALDMNVSYLCRLFKDKTGKTISAYIHEMKIKEAKRLIETTDLSMVQISASLDYSSQTYFQTVFKKVTGMTPMTYKANCSIYRMSE